MKRYKIILIFLVLIAVLGGIFLLATGKPSPTVVSVEPDPSVPLGLTPTFIIKVSRPLPDGDDVDFSVSLGTHVTVTKNEAVYSVTPQVVLSPQTQYALTVTYKNQILRQETYITKSLASLSEQEQQGLQAQADAYYSDQLNKALEARPWIVKLPIVTPKYTVIYNSETGGVAVYQKALLSDKEREAVLNSLQSQQIPITPILWITPTPAP